ncbi:ATP-binding protein [Heyndrickxia acidiproducens]|uniref:ATP-binding protein n=1 Tax=Heyndrickxia acidiproducens TaxID=1121084 RepID=UPI00036F25E7|nr:AAA family ATPase [Heyndrickxia acidiproducens]
MKLLEIHIYGFGKFIDFHLTGLDSFVAIYGENEAGKSTLMAFIQAVLFGFPTRQQAELRYEPKTHDAYGGRLVLQTEKAGIVTVERVRGKAAGDVTVTFADGRIGGEAQLAEMLGGLNKTMFQSIYSFNLLGLQEIRKLKGNDISRYLFAAGTIGTDALLHAEETLQKEMEARFKPNGRKPLLNESLQNLRNREKELNGLKAQNSRYEQLKASQAALEKEQAQIRADLETFRQSLQKVLHDIKIWPLFAKRQQLAQLLAKAGPVKFPVDGLQRMDRLAEQKRSIGSRLTARNRQKQALLQKIKEIEPDPLLEQNSGPIEQLLEEWPQYQQRQAELDRLQFECEALQEQIERLSRMLNLDEESAARVCSLDLSVAAKEKLRLAVHEYERIKTEQQTYRARLKELEDRVHAIEQQCSRLENDFVSEEEFRGLAEKQQQYGKKLEAEAALEKEQKRIELLRRMNTASKQSSAQMLVLAVILLLIGGFGLFAHQYLFLALSVLALAVAGWFYFKKRNTAPLEQELLAITREAEEKSRRLQNWEEDRGALQAYEQQKQLREKWKQLILQLEGYQQQARDIQNRQKFLLAKERNGREALDRLKENFALHRDFQAGQLMDAFELLVDLSGQVRKRVGIRQKLAQLGSMQSAYQEKMAQLWSTLQVRWPLLQEGILSLKKALSAHQERKVLYHEWQNKLLEIEEQENLLQIEKQTIDSEMDQLLHLAGVKDEEAFREAGRNWQIYEQQKNQLAILDTQLKGEDLDGLASRHNADELKQEQLALEKKIDEQSEKLQEINRSLAEVNYEIARLEEGGTFTEKLHQFYSARSVFQEDAREWAKLALAKELLSRMMARLRETRFPQVLKMAGTYLNFLTDGMYLSLHLYEGDRFYVKRKDGVLFSANELSQATAEQLYISLRLSLAEALGAEYPCLLAIDDGFVNFDLKRTGKMARLLQQISKNRQVLLFTCHPHLLDLLKGTHVIRIENGRLTEEKKAGL